MLAREPARLSAHFRLKLVHHRIVAFQKIGIASSGLQRFFRKHCKHAERIVTTFAPGLYIQGRKHLACRAMPTPPQVIGELFEPLDSFR